jgi:hypothetical protein
MRTIRDFDAELKALGERSKALKEKRVRQLGELVIACRADTLDTETLAGALLAAADTADGTIKEGWRKRGAVHFQDAGKTTRRRTRAKPGGAAPGDGGEASA